MRIAIVGGGATGILAAAHLARRLEAAGDEIVVIEPGETLGHGLAYATDDPRHLLNVRVANMSAFADEPDHLTAWLTARRGVDAANPFSFISRGLYGDYLADLAVQTLSSGRVRRVRANCSDIEERAGGVRLTLSTGDIWWWTSRSSPPATTPSRPSAAFRPSSRGAPARSKASRPTRRSSSSARA